MNRKPIVAIDISSTGKGGGPYVSSSRIINSALKEKYDFKTLNYKTEIGSGISWKRIQDLRNQLIQLSPDIVHFTGLQLSGFHIAVACKLAGIKYTVLTIRGTSADALYFHPIKRRITQLLLEPITLLLTKKFYCVSNYVTNRRIARVFKSKCLGAIYNFPPPVCQSKNAGISIREELEIEKEAVVVVTVARIIKDKGYHILDEAILQFVNQPNVKFVIVGDGDYLPQLKTKLKNQIESKQVFCLGYREDVQYIHEGCDIFVLPTLHETLSVALLEASRASLALVASNIGGVPEIVEHDFNGFLVDTGDSEGLYLAINDLVINKEKRNAFGANAKEKVETKFAADIIESQIDNVYKILLKS